MYSPAVRSCRTAAQNRAALSAASTCSAVLCSESATGPAPAKETKRPSTCDRLQLTAYRPQATGYKLHAIIYRYEGDNAAEHLDRLVPPLSPPRGIDLERFASDLTRRLVALPLPLRLRLTRNDPREAKACRHRHLRRPRISRASLDVQPHRLLLPPPRRA